MRGLTSRPRVGVSRCLLGDEVRYDGTHRLDDCVMRCLDPHVEWVPVCPEVEVGMGTPREPIQLVADATGVRSGGETVRLLGVTSGTDWTDRVATWARNRVTELARLDLSGFVLKARSPSCGIDDVVVSGEGGGRKGRGLFAQALSEASLDLPLIDEGALSDPDECARFLERVRRRHASRLVR